MTEHAWTPRERALLESRAEALAARTDVAETKPELALQVCAGRDLFGLPSIAVRGVRPDPRLTIIPGMAPPFVGLFASGEQILPAFSLMALVSAVRVPAEKNYVIELGRGETEVGLMVEDVRAFAEYVPSATAPSLNIPVLGRTEAAVAVLDIDALLRGSLLYTSSTGERPPETTES